MDEIGELDCILDEEHWDVVANNVPVTLLRVELDSETANIPNSVSTATRTLDSRESNKDWRLS